RQGNEIPDQIADGVAGQNILVDLRISEMLDIAPKLFDRAFRNPAAMADEGAQLAQTLQRIASGNSAWGQSETTSASTIRPGARARSTKACSGVTWPGHNRFRTLRRRPALKRRRRAARNSCFRRSAKRLRPQIFYSATLRQSRRPSTAEARPCSTAIGTSWRMPSPEGRFHRKWIFALSRSAKISR